MYRETCKYWELDNINAGQHKGGIIHLNIRGLQGKLDELNNHIANIENQNITINYILLCETFISSHQTTNTSSLPAFTTSLDMVL